MLSGCEFQSKLDSEVAVAWCTLAERPALGGAGTLLAGHREARAGSRQQSWLGRRVGSGIGHNSDCTN